MNIFDLLKNRIFMTSITLLTVFTILYLYTTPEKKMNVELYRFPHFIPRKRTNDEQVRNGVPLVIYESWHSHMLPTGMVENIYNLLEINPEFDYYLFSDEESAEFIKINFDKEVLDAFYMLKPGAFKSDLWRYCVMYKLGGVYLDIKYYSTVPLINVIDENQTIYVRDADAPRTESGCFYNGFLVSPPNNEIFKDCIDDIVKSCKKRLYRRNVLDITGPCMLGRILGKKYSEDYGDTVRFEYSNINGNFWDYYPGISYKGEVILKHYNTYRKEQNTTQKGDHYNYLYSIGNVYNIEE